MTQMETIYIYKIFSSSKKKKNEFLHLHYKYKCCLGVFIHNYVYKNAYIKNKKQGL